LPKLITTKGVVTKKRKRVPGTGTKPQRILLIIVISD
jgi:hypothetical protein